MISDEYSEICPFWAYVRTFIEILLLRVRVYLSNKTHLLHLGISTIIIQNSPQVFLVGE